MSTGHDDLDAWKRQRTVELAFELADSGRYEDFTDIAYALQFERGMATAQALIDDPEMRRLLNQRCSDAREKLAPLPKSGAVIEAEPLAVVEALADTSNEHAELPQAADFERALTVGDLKMDLLSRKVMRGDRAIQLQPREFKLLEFLMRHAGNVVTRTMLLENVWNYHFDPQTNVIDTHISNLRHKIDAGSERPLLKTVRGAGYRLSVDD